MVESPVRVVPVQNSKTFTDFLRVSWTINQSDPCWTPPLIADQKEFLNSRRHPFYLHGSAEKFVAYQNNRPVGRILVSDDPNLNEQQLLNTGAWGMFESIDDTNVSNALFDAAVQWSTEKHGRTELVGPMDYSCNYQVGLLTDGFDTPAMYMMNHNPPYYQRLVLEYGFETAKTLFAWLFTDSNDMLTTWKKRIDWLQERSKIQIRPFNPRKLKEEVKLCREVYNQAQKDHWHYAALSEAEFEYIAQRLAMFAYPEHVLIALDGDKPVGFSIMVPNLNEIIKPLNGKLFNWGLPTGLFRFLWNQKKIKTSRMMVLCILEEYRRRGISEMLILRTIDYGKNVLHYTAAELGWTFADNEKVNNIIKRVGGIPYKTYQIFQKSLGSDASSPKTSDTTKEF